jgi:hypothetical protein
MSHFDWTIIALYLLAVVGLVTERDGVRNNDQGGWAPW